GAYSLAEQAIELGYLPRLTVIHTSQEMMGQIYVPFVNYALMIASILLVIQFRESARLADAYGVAVIGTMLITTLLLFQVMRLCWGWGWLSAGGILLLFLAVDVPFFVGNLTKIATGGWVPLLVGGVLFTIMTTWRKGRDKLNDPNNTQAFHFPLELFVHEITQNKPNRDAETAVFMTAAEDMVPMSLLRMYERTKVLPCRLVLFTVKGVPVPRVPVQEMLEVRHYGESCFGVTARTGFMQGANMLLFLRLCKRQGLELEPEHVYFYLSRMTLVTTRPGLRGWREHLFAFLYHNARPATSYYRLPADRVVELGRMVEI
ncbi:MAG: KUP/HAK/KT family potassium transporter, partial [Gemmataceae bacterium]